MEIEGTYEIKNPGLVKAMNLFLINKTKKNGMQMTSELNKATFLVPIYLPEGTPTDNLKEGLKHVEIQYLMLDQQSTGQSFLMAFTDQEELKKWNPEGCPAVFCPFHEIQEIVLKHKNQCSGVVINPFTHSILFTAKHMEVPGV
ncbi:MAG: SseB family protein [Clostridiales bacterium]|jgi:hypothetical protein|nr:SseB family protein [Clostridiales bacterium]